VIGGRAEALSPARTAPATRLPRLRRAPSLGRLVVTGDVITGAVSALPILVVSGAPAGGELVLAIVLGVAWTACAWISGLYAADGLASWSRTAGARLATGCLLISWPAYGAATLLPGVAPVAVALTVPMLCALGAESSRALARAYVNSSQTRRERVVIVGSGQVAHRLFETMCLTAPKGLEPLGFVDDDPCGPVAADLPHLGELSDLPEVIGTLRVERVIIAFSRAGDDELLRCLRACRSAGVRVDVVPRLFELLDGARTVDGVGGMTLLSISAPAFSPLASAAKRGLDVVGAALGLIALAPLFALIAAAIKLDSPGPVLFRQSRTGRGGRTFVLYKFRSMRAGSGVLVRSNGALLKAADDDRITRVGRLLRRCSLDEAPQLFNVLRGEMSLVGPRPLVAPEAHALCESWHMRRADLRPGLTGLWQISGRSFIGFEDMIRLDFEYVTGWSLARDLEILTATVPAVLSGRGAR
jgi:exopolysaccharide biosynthesis polyprenyl glycosylphosphotransferase